MENKGNDGKGNIPERDLWETKKELFDSLNNQFNFTFDCCANESNKKCEFWHNNFEKVGTEEAGLSEEDIAWMNPPFSNAFKMFKHFFEVVDKGVAIYRCDNMETKVWQDIILKNATWIFIPKGRIAYTPFETGDMRKGMGTRFPSALIGVGLESPENLEGITLLIKNNSLKNEETK